MSKLCFYINYTSFTQSYIITYNHVDFINNIFEMIGFKYHSAKEELMLFIKIIYGIEIFINNECKYNTFDFDKYGINHLFFTKKHQCNTNIIPEFIFGLIHPKSDNNYVITHLLNKFCINLLSDFNTEEYVIEIRNILRNFLILVLDEYLDSSEKEEFFNTINVIIPNNYNNIKSLN